MKYIKCCNVTKSFGNNLVLDNFNFVFSSDSINFITGANGIGKSTLISCILEFLKFKGVIVSNVEKVLYQPEKVILPDYIKLKDYLLLIGKIHKSNCIDKMNELIKLFGLEKVINKDLIKLSKGMRQKVLLIQTLMMEADAYFFDEPLSGLDPLSQQILVEEIIKLVSKDKLIIIVTHFIEQYRINNKKIVNLNNKEDYQNVTTPS
jgi:ABC-2 type transport system ATP-binding protein